MESTLSSLNGAIRDYQAAIAFLSGSQRGTQVSNVLLCVNHSCGTVCSGTIYLPIAGDNGKTQLDPKGEKDLSGSLHISVKDASLFLSPTLNSTVLIGYHKHNIQREKFAATKGETESSEGHVLES